MIFTIETRFHNSVHFKSEELNALSFYTAASVLSYVQSAFGTSIYGCVE